MTATTHLAEVRLDRARGLSHQIRKQVRDLIVAGKLQPDEKIPGTRELAQLWQTHVPIVHDALAPLVAEGLLIRQPGIGTIVRRREAKLTHIGIYYMEDYFAKGGSLFRQSIHAALKAELNVQDLEVDVWIDPRSEREESAVWPALLRAAEQRRFQALIVPATNRPHLQWLNRLTVPTAFLTSGNLPNAVGLDWRQFAEVSLRRLKEQGCRSVGLINPLPTEPRPMGGRHIHEVFFEQFVEVCGTLGLQVKNQWMRVARHDTDMVGRSEELFGYEQFLELWKHPERPDGLVVSPDNVVRGVMLALREQQVRVPEELQLVLHKNEAIDLLCPVPATLAVTSEREIARALIQQVQKQFRGEPVEPVLLPVRLMAQSGSGR